jgi:hypothetical protein
MGKIALVITSAIALAVFAAPCVARAADGQLVRVIVHVPLELPRALPGARGPWYCAPRAAHDDVPIGNALLVSYERELRAHGAVMDHVGFGTWTVGSSATSDVAFEEDDHLEIVAPQDEVRAWLRPFLRRVRADLAQREALGEVFGIVDPTLGEPRTALTVTLAPAHASFESLRTLHHIFGNRGNGGASQYTDERGVHLYSAVVAADVSRIEAELRAAGYAWTSEPETFVAVDAPPCP